MNDKQAREKLKKIDKSRGVGEYTNSRRDKNKRHETMNNALTEMQKMSLSKVSST